MEKSKAMPVIIGGMVFDIHATASVPSTAKSTTPGKIQFMLGGVARNIAECLLKLGTKSFMISALGGDLTGDLLLGTMEIFWVYDEARISQLLQYATCSTINGDLTAGVASVESIERYVTPQWIQQFKSVVHSAPLLMVDANLSPEALEASCRLWFEPVSVTKSKRVAGIAKYITFASPNEHELIAMANSLSNDIDFAQSKGSRQNKEFHRKGIKYVLVTLGPDGAFLCSRGGPSDLKQCLNGSKKMDGKRELFDMRRLSLSVVHFPALPATVGRVSGAGDCLVGGSVASLCSGLNVMQSVAVGVAAAKAAIEADTNVASHL
ncbi:Pseudouridine kinase [Bienertia sinuspersici]